jgi:hypothetical protein
MGWIIFYGVIVYIANIVFCTWLALEKHRGIGIWIFLSIILPVVSIIALAGAPILQSSETQSSPSQPLKCPFCDYECLNTGSLENHIKSTHPESAQK